MIFFTLLYFRDPPSVILVGVGGVVVVPDVDGLVLALKMKTKPFQISISHKFHGTILTLLQSSNLTNILLYFYSCTAGHRGLKFPTASWLFKM